MATNDSTHQKLPPGNWKPVVGYENAYMVSADGRVWSMRRPNPSSIYRSMHGTTIILGWIGGHELKQATDKDGYKVVGLSRDGKAKSFRVHRLMLDAFIGPCPEGKESCHFNDIPDDNRIENLRWDYPKMNVEDRKRNRRAATMRGPKTHCTAGHFFSAENSIWRPGAHTPRCRECERARDRKRRPRQN